MPTYLPVFTSPAGQAEVFAAYQAVLYRWPVPYTELDFQTSIGLTHVIASEASGVPENPPIVFMHALFATATAWYRNVGPLSRHFRTYAIDVPGEANKSRPTRMVTALDDMARWFEEMLDNLGIEQTYLVGNSYGAFMSAYYAMRLPGRIRGVVLIGPAATFHPMMPFYLHMFIPKALGLFFPWLPGQATLMRHAVDWMHAGLPRDPVWEPLFYRAMLHGRMTNQILPRVYSPAEFSQLTSPTLLLVGRREQIYPPQAAIEAAKRLMPNVQTELIPDGHHVTAISQPGLVNQRLLRFFGVEASSPEQESLAMAA